MDASYQRRLFFSATAVTAVVGGISYCVANAPERHFRRALDDLRAGDAEKVQYALVSLNRADSEARASLLRSWLGLQLGPDDAETLAQSWTDLQYAFEGDSNRALLLALTGRALYRAGRLAEAENVLQQSLREDPDELEAHRGLGIIWYDLGVMPRALHHLERVSELNPKNVGPCRLMGLIYTQEGDLEQAAAAYREALTRQCSQEAFQEISLDLARCLFTRHKYEEALDAATRGGSGSGLLGMAAECCYALGRIEDARDYVTRALMQNPDHAETLGVAATLASHDGNLQESLRLLLCAVAVKPRDYELQYRLMEAYRRVGDERQVAQAKVVEELRRLNDRLNELIDRANDDVRDPALRRQIAELAARLDMHESAENWLKAARMLEAVTPLP